jgi:hypothetical protein
VKVIFLDIDGVVATNKSYGTHRVMEELTWGVSDVPFDEVCVKSLNKITDYTDAKIVISSSWRGSYKLDELKVMLAREGITGDIIGVTPESGYSIARAEEIKMWLREHASAIESFVVLDDQPADIRRKFPNNFIQTSMQMGLIPVLAEKAIEILKKRVQ